MTPHDRKKLETLKATIERLRMTIKQHPGVKEATRGENQKVDALVESIEKNVKELLDRPNG
jgi:hypothetical protein